MIQSKTAPERQDLVIAGFFAHVTLTDISLGYHRQLCLSHSYTWNKNCLQKGITYLNSAHLKAASRAHNKNKHMTKCQNTLFSCETLCSYDIFITSCPLIFVYDTSVQDKYESEKKKCEDK